MASIPMGYSGFVPSRREPDGNDHRWLAAYERRTAGRRMARRNLVDGETAASQNAQLSWGTPLRRTRHLYGAAAEAALLARARRERAEAAPVIARAQQRSREAARSGTGTISRAWTGPGECHGCATLATIGASAEEVRKLHAGHGNYGTRGSMRAVNPFFGGEIYR